MPNYDIIPLATDLLDYTIQRVKAKEPQYTKVKAYVMENGQMVEKELFEKIKDDGKPHFPKSQTFHMHPLKCYHLAASEMDLYKLFHGKPSERAKKGDRVLLIRTIQLTADLTVTCPVTFLMLPDIQFITKPFALRTAWEDDRSSAVLCFRSCSKAESVLSLLYSHE